MADDQHDYKVGPGHPPLHTRFRKGQSRNPGGRSKKQLHPLHALLADALNEPAFVTIDRERRKQARGGRRPADRQSPRSGPVRNDPPNPRLKRFHHRGTENTENRITLTLLRHFRAKETADPNTSVHSVSLW
jgi:hypothetical protein